MVLPTAISKVASSLIQTEATGVRWLNATAMFISKIANSGNTDAPYQATTI